MDMRVGSLPLSLLILGCQPGGAGSPTPEPPAGGDAGNQDRGGAPGDSVSNPGPRRSVLAYVNRAEAMGITGPVSKRDIECLTFTGSGSAWGDVDLDGRVDLFTTNPGGPNYLYLNQGDLDHDGLPDFEDWATRLGIEQSQLISHSAVFIDYDNDGDQDLYVTHRKDGNTLWENRVIPEGSLRFVDVTAQAGLADNGLAITTAWGDLDQDGFLDVYLAKHQNCFNSAQGVAADRLFHSQGDGRFESWTRYLCDEQESCTAIEGLGFAAAFLDHDNDGDPDLYVVNDGTHGGASNRHWRNDGPDGMGGWLLTESSRFLGTSTRVNGMGLGVGDYDNDGWLDLAFTNVGESHVLRNTGHGDYEDVTSTCGVFPATMLHVGWGASFFDADNDGWLDLYFANGPIYATAEEPNTFLHNLRDGTFEDLSFESGLDGTRKGRNLSLCDVDDDGFVDLFVGNLGQQPYLYMNQGSLRHSTQHWLTVTLEGTVSNRDAIGARLWLSTRGSRQMREITSGPSHGGGDQKAAFFGLGDQTVGLLSVRWPSGVEQSIGLVRADQRLHLVEPRD